MAHDLKPQLIQALRQWVAQRPGLDYGNYGNVSSYRSEVRSIGKDLQDARKLIDYVAWHDSITAEMILDAAKSGRLSIKVVRDRECMTCKHEWSAPVTHGPTANISGEHTCYCPKCNSRAVISMPQRITIDYCTGQYWPTEYRPVVCRLLSSVIWYWMRDNMLDPITGDDIRRQASRELGTSIARKWFA